MIKAYFWWRFVMRYTLKVSTGVSKNVWIFNRSDIDLTCQDTIQSTALVMWMQITSLISLSVWQEFRIGTCEILLPVKMQCGHTVLSPRRFQQMKILSSIALAFNVEVMRLLSIWKPTIWNSFLVLFQVVGKTPACLLHLWEAFWFAMTPDLCHNTYKWGTGTCSGCTPCAKLEGLSLDSDRIPKGRRQPS